MPLDTPDSTHQPYAVAAIVPSYNEQPDAIEQTIRALSLQSCPFEEIVLVDDGSATPQGWESTGDARLRNLRLPANTGISAARNAAIATTRTEFVACINVEVLPATNWLALCLEYISSRPTVGIVGTNVELLDPDRRSTKWRRMFHERPVKPDSGQVKWLMGHGMLIRREAFDAVGGYDERFRRIGEDVDICRRMREHDWEVHLVTGTSCLSIQDNSVEALARTELTRSGWSRDPDEGFFRAARKPTHRTLLRMGRHVLRGRIGFLWTEFRIWQAGMDVLWKYHS